MHYNIIRSHTNLYYIRSDIQVYGTYRSYADARLALRQLLWGETPTISTIETLIIDQIEAKLTEKKNTQ